jgi:hypothetical protein
VREEAFRRLVLLPVFKTGVTRYPGQAGSIPVRLRMVLPVSIRLAYDRILEASPS